MCVDHTIICTCGSNQAGFNFKDEVMPQEVVRRLYCPKCSGAAAFDSGSMISDNGWVIEFDMEVARFAGERLRCAGMTPSFIFDEGYCTWRGVYPTDHLDSVRERRELFELSKVNPRKYLEEFRRWGIDRMERLCREGWRKAHV